MTTLIIVLLFLVAVIIFFINFITRNVEHELSDIFAVMCKILVIPFFISLYFSLWISLAIAITFVLSLLIISPAERLYRLVKLSKRTPKEAVMSMLKESEIRYEFVGNSFIFGLKGERVDFKFQIYVDEERVICACFPDLKVNLNTSLQTLIVLNDINERGALNTWSIDNDQIICVSSTLLVHNSMVTNEQVYLLIKIIISHIESEYDLLTALYSPVTENTTEISS